MFWFIPYFSAVPSVHINVTSTLPTSAGLGSSAAFSTCLSTSLLVSSKIITAKTTLDGVLQLTAVDRELINRWAFMAEKIIHGRPSGIDNSVSTYGELFSGNVLVTQDNVSSYDEFLSANFGCFVSTTSVITTNGMLPSHVFLGCR